MQQLGLHATRSHSTRWSTAPVRWTVRRCGWRTCQQGCASAEPCPACIVATAVHCITTLQSATTHTLTAALPEHSAYLSDCNFIRETHAVKHLLGHEHSYIAIVDYAVLTLYLQTGNNIIMIILHYILFLARDSMLSALYAERPSVRLSVRLSVTLVDQSKTVEVRIMQFSPYSSPIPLVFTV